MQGLEFALKTFSLPLSKSRFSGKGLAADHISSGVRGSEGAYSVK